MFKIKSPQITSVLLILLSMKSVAQTPTKVDVIHPEISQNLQYITLIGTVEAEQHAQLAPLQSGVVETLYVEIGDHVEKGQPLLALDAKLANLSVTQSQASVVAAKATKAEAQRLYQEVIALSEKQVVAQTLIAERHSMVAVATAELKHANALLLEQQEVAKRHTLYAPFAGVIAKRNVNLGEWVTQQNSVFTLVEQDKLRLNIAIPQEYYGQLVDQDYFKSHDVKAHGVKVRGVKVHDIEVQVSPDFTQSQIITGTLDRLVSVAQGTSRTITGLVNLPSHAQLVTGMSARAKIQLPASEKPIVWLPKSAIKQHPDGGKSVFAVQNQKAKRLLVHIVRERDDQVAVTGVSDSVLERLPLVVSGVELLKNDDLLTVSTTKGDTL